MSSEGWVMVGGSGSVGAECDDEGDKDNEDGRYAKHDDGRQ